MERSKGIKERIEVAPIAHSEARKIRRGGGKRDGEIMRTERIF